MGIKELLATFASSCSSALEDFVRVSIAVASRSTTQTVKFDLVWPSGPFCNACVPDTKEALSAGEAVNTEGHDTMITKEFEQKLGILFTQTFVSHKLTTLTRGKVPIMWVLSTGERRKDGLDGSSPPAIILVAGFEGLSQSDSTPSPVDLHELIENNLRNFLCTLREA